MNYQIEKSHTRPTLKLANGTTMEVDRYHARAWKVTSKGEKLTFNYYFSKEADRDAYVDKFVAGVNERNARKEALKAAKKAIANPYKVGEILYDSWGYDQTNIDFYQIVEVGKKSVKIREIKQRITKDMWAASMAEYVAAVPDAFTSEPKSKNVQVYLDSNGKPVYYLSARFGGSLSKWDGTPKYQSHYA